MSVQPYKRRRRCYGGYSEETMSYTIPSDVFNVAAAEAVYAFVTNPTTANKRDALDGALCLIDYGSQFVIGPSKAAEALKIKRDANITDAELLKGLIEEQRQPRAMTVATWTPPAWLLPLALQVIQDILTLLAKGG